MQRPFTRSALPLLFLALLLTATGCGPKSSTPHVTSDDTEITAKLVWNSYLAAAALRPSSAPFRLQASLRYSTPESGHRVLLRAWGNGEFPVRLDLEAGIGATIARIKQDQSSFIAYSPRENTAVTNTGGNDALLRFGLPVPFTIGDLGHLLNGRFDKVFPTRYDRVTLVPDEGFAYTLAAQQHGGRLHGTLTLDNRGRLIQWESVPVQGKRWKVTFSRYPATDELLATKPAQPEELPEKISIQYGSSHSAVFIIKQREVLTTPFTEDQLELILPDGTIIKQLRHAKAAG